MPKANGEILKGVKTRLLEVELPEEKPCEHAFSLKIEL